MSRKTSQISGFYKLSVEERLEKVKTFANLSEEEIALLQKSGSLEMDLANRMIENVIGVVPVPLGLAVNFLINDKEYLIPMAIEEPSVVAAASNAAKIARKKGGFTTSTTGPIMIGQIQAVDIEDPHGARLAILAAKEKILGKANEQDPVLVRFGGGAKDFQVKVIEASTGPMVITELLVDARDAMGANAVNTMVEAVAPMIEDITNGRVFLRILSNLADRRLMRARAIFDKEAVGGEEVVDGVLQAYAFAMADPYRCATHNKGIMNGIDAVVVATCNDWRAVEAGAHTYAATRDRSYTSLTTWEKNKDGDLVGTIELPVAVGILGGATGTHPIAKITRKILGVESASELGQITAAVGLAQNLAALRALATVGIQRGHMKLHARNIAASVGATGDLIDKIATKMVEEGKIRMDRAQELLKEYQNI
ncbi:MAG: hydroxymethylglutaryl-CoA reductase, degradative [Candidatus Aenigmarchaeota archaeon]|nr:hydroxymethylglutaryl-CoA reductase, degradative [Candidatus Aenigmarchaeota archaeon]